MVLGLLYVKWADAWYVRFCMLHGLLCGISYFVRYVVSCMVCGFSYGISAVVWYAGCCMICVF